MHTEVHTGPASAPASHARADAPADDDRTASLHYEVIRRNGKRTRFDPRKISVAMTKAFLAVEGGSAAASARIRETVDNLTAQVLEGLLRRLPAGGTVHIESIQDQVELAMMRDGHHAVARAYVLYREEHARLRAERSPAAPDTPSLPNVALADGRVVPLAVGELERRIRRACDGVDDIDPKRVLEGTLANVYDGIAEASVEMAATLSARQLIEHDPGYSRVAARLLLDTVHREVAQATAERPDRPPTAEADDGYPSAFARSVHRGIALNLLDPELARFDLSRLGEALDPGRDRAFTYLGLQTLYDRYFLQHDGLRLELPQGFFMRVAMGLAMREVERDARAIEFYRLLSSFDFMSSTPTLFNSGTLRPQLSSCYLTTVPDDLDGIFGAVRDNALLSKFAGGLGNDWTRVRGLGARINGTNGTSQGVVPFLKVANDTAVAVNQGGKRKGAVCAYLETWHIDIEEFLDLRKNTGDDRRRTHDMNTANWIPDLFMRRVADDGDWTLFSPDEVPELHELTGRRFQEAYERYEQMADRGEVKVWKRLSAVSLWRRMLGQLFETGHPWLTFKDPCNLRYTNRHQGVVHSSNLCTEITLHTNDAEIAVCNLGSINLAAHLDDDGLDMTRLERTVTTAMRMLDNVIDDNWYSVPQARNSNLRHRPVGLGIMGFQDALYRQGLPYACEEAVAFADRSMEAVSYFAIRASADLAEERGRYPSFEGSLWSQGVLPIDSLALLEEERGGHLEVDRSTTLDWSALRERIIRTGMRNSNCLAIAPTATIANICGVSPSIDPAYQNLYVKSNLSGEFTMVNPALVDDLKRQGLWDTVMVNDLKYYDGSVQAIDRVPQELRKIYACAFEIDPRWLVEAASRRQKWIDQSQSLNLYMAEASGSRLDNLYKLAWVRGLKTTYYLRSLGATHVEKASAPAATPAACAIDDPDCEACQ